MASPAGQAAWSLEKFWAWTDCNGHPENVLTRDELLDKCRREEPDDVWMSPPCAPWSTMQAVNAAKHTSKGFIELVCSIEPRPAGKVRLSFIGNLTKFENLAPDRYQDFAPFE